MVLRLDPALADRLRVIADVEGRTVSDVVREAARFRRTSPATVIVVVDLVSRVDDARGELADS